MARDSAPAYQWYPKDARSDEKYLLMSYEQRGIYHDLLDHQWVEGSIPADPAQIRRILPGMTARRFAALWPGIASAFTPSSNDGRLVNQRLDEQRRGLKRFAEKASADGIKGAETRWGGYSHPNGNPIATPLVSDSSSIFNLQSSISKEYVQGFERFWASYPKHTDEANARRLWAGLAPNESFTDRIVAGAERYAVHVRDWDSQYVKSPTRWLKGEHWNDELGRPAGGASQLPGPSEWVCPHEPNCGSQTRCKITTRLNEARRERGAALLVPEKDAGAA